MHLSDQKTTTLPSVHAYSTFVGLGPTCRSTMEPTRSSNEGSTNELKLVTGNDGRMAIVEFVGLCKDGTLELKMRPRVAVVTMKMGSGCSRRIPSRRRPQQQ